MSGASVNPEQNTPQRQADGDHTQHERSEATIHRALIRRFAPFRLFLMARNYIELPCDEVNVVLAVAVRQGREVNVTVGIAVRERASGDRAVEDGWAGLPGATTEEIVKWVRENVRARE